MSVDDPYVCPACRERTVSVAVNATDDPEKITCFCNNRKCRVAVFTNKKTPNPWLSR